MIMVQKITQVAFAVHDGKARRDSELSEDQREQKLTSIPGPLEYFSFMFCFHSILTGPVCTIREYQEFMKGSNFTNHAQSNAKEEGGHVNEPSALYPVLTRLFWSLASLGLFIGLGNFNSNLVLEPQYSLPARLVFNHVNILRIRARYYFFWLMAESFNNCAGLGFSGYSKSGRTKWDLISNVDLVEIELATSMRTFATQWNALTARWLRRCVYERAPFAPTLMTFVLSAWWHGVYPGYYMTFIYLAFVIEASRKMRRLLHHHFQKYWALRMCYDVLTWSLTYIYLGFALPIDLMLFSKSITFWSYYYYFPLISVCVVTFFFPSGKKHKQSTKEEKSD